MAEAQDWIPVGALSEAFTPDANLLPQAEGLSAKTLSLHLENGWLIRLAFSTVRTLRWAVHTADAGGEPELSAEIPCSVTEIRPSIYFVDFINPRERAGTVSLVLDMTLHICTVVLGTLPTSEQTDAPLSARITRGDELTGVKATFLSGTIDTPSTASAEKHGATIELVGKRIEYTYSASERYEHVYLNERFYTWHCLSGSEAGLADTDRCHYFRLAHHLYLFTWREKIVPTLGVVIVDLEQMKTTGKVFGYRDLTSGALVNFPVGARARVLGS